jgi:sulfopyruvate decarboxylase TPP-binding subunit
MTVSYDNSKAVLDGIKAASTRSASDLPESWLGLLLQRAEDDPDFDLVQVAREAEATASPPAPASPRRRACC